MKYIHSPTEILTPFNFSAVLNETDIVVDLTKGYNNQELNAFQELANSKFGLIIRGDNMFTYRFSEVCAMGVVPGE